RHPGERRPGRPPGQRLRDRALRFQRRHPAPEPGGGQGDGQRAPRRHGDRARACDPLADRQAGPLGGPPGSNRHPGGGQDGRRGAVERQPLQLLRPGRERLDRRRPALPARQRGAAAAVRLHPRLRQRRCPMSRRDVTHTRHSREGGNPWTLGVAWCRGKRPWIPAFAGMTARALAAAALALGLALPAMAQDLLIRNATVHTATGRGTLEGTDVLVRAGRIAAIGNGLSADGAQTVDAQGKPLTPALFGGSTGMGVEEVAGEESARDNSLALGEGAKDMTVRPEFDVTLAYNPDSMLIPVSTYEGIGF